MLAALVEVENDWVVVVAGPPETEVVVRDCRFSILDELVIAVVEWVLVVPVPVGVRVVVRGMVDEDPPEDFVDVRDWAVVMVEVPPVLVVVVKDQLVLLVTVVSARDTVLPVVVGDRLVADIVIPEKDEFETRVVLTVPAVFPVGCWVVSVVVMTPVTDSLPTVEEL